MFNDTTRYNAIMSTLGEAFLHEIMKGNLGYNRDENFGSLRAADIH